MAHGSDANLGQSQHVENGTHGGLQGLQKWTRRRNHKVRTIANTTAHNYEMCVFVQCRCHQRKPPMNRCALCCPSQIDLAEAWTTEQPRIAKDIDVNTWAWNNVVLIKHWTYSSEARSPRVVASMAVFKQTVESPSPLLRRTWFIQ